MAQDDPPREPTPVDRERRRMQVDGVVFGARMRQTRKRRGWSVHDLHDVTGVAASTISDLENGKTANPAPWVTHVLAVALGCPSAGDMVAWAAARERGEPYEPEGGRGLPFGPARVPGVGGTEPVLGAGATLDVLTELLLRGLWRAQAASPRDGDAAQLTTLGLGLFLLHPRARGRRGPARRRGAAGVIRRKAP